jgi:chromosome partitioning protein
LITLCVLNRKGGVGKTTIATNLVQALGLLEKRVLVIDNDEQANMSFSLGIKKEPEVNLASVYKDPSVILGSIYSTRLETVDIIAGSPRLATLRPNRNLLKEALSNQVIKDNFEYVVIDNGPSLDEMTLGAIEASDHYIIPVIPDTFAVQGLISLMKNFESKGIDTNKVHILVNRYQQTILSKMSHDFLCATYDNKVLKSIIPQDNSLAVMVAQGKSLLLSKSTSKSVVPFLELIMELFNFNIDEMMAKLKEVREKAKKENFEKNLAPRIYKSGRKALAMESSN